MQRTKFSCAGAAPWLTVKRPVRPKSGRWTAWAVPEGKGVSGNDAAEPLERCQTELERVMVDIQSLVVTTEMMDRPPRRHDTQMQIVESLHALQSKLEESRGLLTVAASEAGDRGQTKLQALEDELTEIRSEVTQLKERLREMNSGREASLEEISFQKFDCLTAEETEALERRWRDLKEMMRTGEDADRGAIVLMDMVQVVQFLKEQRAPEDKAPIEAIERTMLTRIYDIFVARFPSDTEKEKTIKTPGVLQVPVVKAAVVSGPEEMTESGDGGGGDGGREDSNGGDGGEEEGGERGGAQFLILLCISLIVLGVVWGIGRREVGWKQRWMNVRQWFEIEVMKKPPPPVDVPEANTKTQKRRNRRKN